MQPMENNQGEVIATLTVGAGPGASMTNNIGIQQGDSEMEEGMAIGTSTPSPKPSAAPANEKLAGISPVATGSGSAASTSLPSYPVGRGISLPSGRFLPRCDKCDCRALIARTNLVNFIKNGVLCLDHGLDVDSVTQDLVIRTASQPRKVRYGFISPEHEAAIRAAPA